MLHVNFWDRQARFLEQRQIEYQLGYIMILIENGICQNDGKYAIMNQSICQGIFGN